MRLLALLLACTAICAGRAAAAPLRALVRVPGPDEEDLLLRLRGQTVDLDVSLIVERRPIEPALSGQLAAAAALAAAHGARVIVWVSADPQGGGRLLCVGEPGRGRVLLRSLPGPRPRPLDDPGDRSVAAEGAALVVRSALQALLRGDPVGVPTASLAKPPRPSPSLPSSPLGAAAPRRTGFFLGAGWQVALDGQSPAGQHALVLHGGLRLKAISLGLFGAAALPARLRDDVTEVSLSRHGAGASAAYALALSPRLRLSVGGALGVLLFQRATLALSPEVTAAPDGLTPAFSAAPEARLIVVLKARPGLLGELILAADVPIGAPELGYAGPGGGFEVRNRLWPVQPRFGLSIYYDR